jgi:hypothetical protein
MLQNRSQEIRDYLRRAEECRRLAKTALGPQGNRRADGWAGSWMRTQERAEETDPRVHRAAINIASRPMTGNCHNGRDEQMFGAK